MKYLLLSIFVACLCFPSFAQLLPITYSRVKIDLRETSISKVSQLGLETDHGEYARGKYLISDFSNLEIDLLEDNNIPFKIMIADVKKHYANQNAQSHIDKDILQRSNNDCRDVDVQFDVDTPENYEFGSMGGYLTYDELLVALDDMSSQFPDLITVRQQIGTRLTHEGRPIFWLRISDNPNDEEGEPEILYTALHHAREPNSLSQMIFYMWHLLENYETDPEVKYLVDNTAMHFIPCVNPDGYVFNESTDPDGGGLWRKNRAVENGQVVGVDLNRNYGFEWAFDNQGSSSNSNSEIYRGLAPFSEPETQTVRDFCNDHLFRICMNYHTFGNVLIYPFGFNDEETPDQASYEAFTQAMTTENNFPAGTGLETVGSTANGDADDWMYGDVDSKPKILSLTPEVGPGTFGFWPPASAIDNLNKSVLRQNLVSAHLLLNYGEAEEIDALDFLIQREGTFEFNLKKFGLLSGELNLRIIPIGTNLTLENNSLTVNTDHLDEANLVVEYAISEGIEEDQDIQFVIEVDNGEFVTQDTITKRFLIGQFETILSDDGTNPEDWTFTDLWASTTSDFVSPPSSYTDSPTGNYASNTNSSATWEQTLDLANTEQALLNYYARWDIEPGFDYVQILASTDNINFTPLCGRFTRLGNENQDEGEPLYDGTQDDWVLEEIDLSDFLGQTITIQFRLVSDEFVEGDGFYFDDIRLRTLNANPVSTTSTLADNSLDVFPNPFNDVLQIDFNLLQSSEQVTLRLINSLGQVAQEVNNQSYNQGQNKVIIDSEGLAYGVYFLQLVIDGEVAGVERVVKVE